MRTELLQIANKLRHIANEEVDTVRHQETYDTLIIIVDVINEVLQKNKDHDASGNEYERTGPRCHECRKPSLYRHDMGDFYCPECDIKWWEDT